MWDHFHDKTIHKCICTFCRASVRFLHLFVPTLYTEVDYEELVITLLQQLQQLPWGKKYLKKMQKNSTVGAFQGQCFFIAASLCRVIDAKCSGWNCAIFQDQINTTEIFEITAVGHSLCPTGSTASWIDSCNIHTCVCLLFITQFLFQVIHRVCGLFYIICR